MIRDARFGQRPFYSEKELDDECERIVTQFLMRRHGGAKFPIATDDLAGLIETEAEDLDQYADLRDFGQDVEGVTMFVPRAKPIVKISASLAEPRRENRLRTTMTHEFGHAKFHSILFGAATQTADLFDDEPGAGFTQVCARDKIVEAQPVDWMEWQAGYVCGAILMPASILRSVIHEKFPGSIERGLTANPDVAQAMVEEVRGRFRVSPDAARVRLKRLGVIPDVANAPRLI
jgi:Zn-dependent peptidase ImmA (M78 family)